MRITSRLLLLFVLITLSFAGYFYLFIHIKNTESRIFQESDLYGRKQTIDSMFEIKKETQKGIVNEYQISEEMIRFLKTRRAGWAQRNLGSLIKAHGFALVQVYDTEKRLVWSEHDPTLPNLQDFRYEPALLDSLSSKHSMDFLVKTNLVLLQTIAGTIHEAADSSYAKPLGYIMIGDSWDSSFFMNLAKSINYNLTIGSVEPLVGDKTLSQYNIRIVRPMADWRGTNQVWLTFYVTNPYLKQMQSIGKQVIFGTGGFILLFLFIHFLLIEQWISIPLNMISKSLRENKPDIISKLSDKNNEFSDIAILIEQFFAQRQSLFKEIDERKRTEARLRDAEQQTLSIFLTSPESIVVTDTHGNILTYNEEATRLLGIVDGQNSNVRDNVLGEDREAFEEMLRSLLTGEHIRNQELEVRHLSGESFPALISASVIFDDFGEPNRLIFITRDLSELKSLESQLIQAQKMESLGTLAGGIAHDFNNIMTIIAGYIAVSAAKIDGHFDAQNDLDEALKACLRAKSLISKILTFSRQTERLVQTVVLADILTDSLPMIRASLPTSINIKTDIHSHQHCMADPTEIQQVLMNLSSNAFFAMRKTGGTLTFGIREVAGFELIGIDPSVQLGTDYLQLSVEDTGMGISQNILGRIFDPYFSTKTTGEGTGLGLSIVHGIVKNSNGFINVHSVQDEGTKIMLYFPVSSPVELPKAPPKPKEIPFIPARIIFVDDEVALTELFGEALVHAGYQVRIFSDSLLAYDAFAKDPESCDILIADVTMPVLDGIRLSKKIREISKVPIILYTGYSVYNLDMETENIDVNRLLSKPILPGDMIGIVKEVLAEVNPS